MPSLKSQAIGKEFDHIIAYTLLCTLKNEDVSEMSYEELKFVLLDEVTKVDNLVYLKQGNEKLNKGSKPCLDRGMQWGRKFLLEATACKGQ